MEKVEKVVRSPSSHLWISFVLKAIFIASVMITVFGVCCIIVGYTFGGKTLDKLPLVVTITAAVASSMYLNSFPVLFNCAHWNFTKGSVLAAFVLAVGKLVTPYFTDILCLASTGSVCAPVTGSILATIDIAIAGAIIWNTDGYEMNRKT
ncbi:hypothetical protein MOSE0_E06810 [Monosporozyma servazzii]